MSKSTVFENPKISKSQSPDSDLGKNYIGRVDKEYTSLISKILDCYVYSDGSVCKFSNEISEGQSPDSDLGENFISSLNKKYNEYAFIVPRLLNNCQVVDGNVFKLPGNVAEGQSSNTDLRKTFVVSRFDNIYEINKYEILSTKLLESCINSGHEIFVYDSAGNIYSTPALSGDIPNICHIGD